MLFWQNNRGKVIGCLIGLLFAISVIKVGFWLSIFILVCLAIGYFVGRMFDGKVDIKQAVDNLFKSNKNNSNY
jgi:uncharacterized membrane protein